MRSNQEIFVVLREIMGLLAAPWILRILLYYEAQSDSGEVTEKRIVDAVTQKFKDKLNRQPPSQEEILRDLFWLHERNIVETGNHRVQLTEEGRTLAKELSPAASAV